MALRETSNFLRDLLQPILILICMSGLPRSTEAVGGPLLSRSVESLKVVVPVKTDFNEFVDCTDYTNVKGFCIDVFNSALAILIPKPSWTDVNYTCHQIGDDSYDTLVDILANSDEAYDAVVGDVTISAKRLMKVSFTQTYLDSGIVILSPDKDISQRFPGVFFTPFTNETWAFLILSILLTGSTLWLLERKYKGQHSLQIATSRIEQFKRIFWFATSILIFFRRDSMKNPLSKFVLLAWVLFILLLGSSYTASLSSILTVNELSQKSLTMEDLYNMNKTVGYQVGSVVEGYLRDRHKLSNLKPLYNVTQYADALHSKQVVAVVDEIPYISLFLAAQSASNCKFSVSKKLTIEGLGYAFYNRSLSAAFSVALLNLSESGQLQRLQDGWKLSNFQCPSRVQSTQLDLQSSQGLFVFLGAAMVVIMSIFVMKHALFPHSIQAYVRLRGNQQGDAIDGFGGDPSAHASSRRSIQPTDDLQPWELS